MPERPVPLVRESGDPEVTRARPHALCRMYAADGTLLSAEAAEDPAACFAKREGGKRWGGKIARETVAWYGSPEDALEAERLAGEEESPAYGGGDGDGMLSAKAAARRGGVSYATWLSYVSRELAPPADLPGRWKPETVDAWREARPGRGVAGGRPRKDGSPAQPRQGKNSSEIS